MGGRAAKVAPHSGAKIVRRREPAGSSDMLVVDSDGEALPSQQTRQRRKQSIAAAVGERSPRSRSRSISLGGASDDSDKSSWRKGSGGPLGPETVKAHAQTRSPDLNLVVAPSV